MMKTQLAICLALLAIQGAHAEAQDWKQATGPLKTRWAKEVTPDNALPEYPRMQMVRKDWLNLNGLWNLKLGDGTESKILVPYPPESALSGVMKHSDRLTYRRTFAVPKDWLGQRVLLHFGAVDWEAKVSVNGQELGTHRGGYDEFSFDITDALKPAGPQEVTVEVFDPTDDSGQPRGKQTLKPGGIMYTPTSGIWQTVWLEPVPAAHIEALRIVPDVDAGCVHVTVVGKGDVEVIALGGGREVGRAKGQAGTVITIPVRHAKLWSPDAPFLYDLKIKCGGDEVSSYFGMRKIALAKDAAGITRPMLNGEFIFQVGPLDQGFWPDGLYTAPTDAALKFDIEMTKKLGMNCTRKHIKVEPDRWYYWCDKLGLLVWQDMPSVNSYTDKPQPINVPQFETELVRMVTNLWNHPSIIMWVLFNESQGQHNTEALVAKVKALDPSRLINNASGDADKHCGDVIDRHSYPGPGSPKPEEKRAAVLGEFGGLGLPVDGHTWTQKTWGYKGVTSRDELTRSFVKLMAKAWALKDNPGLSATIYTQITDVETECNGLLTYDREIVKVDIDRVAAANRGKFPPPPEVKVIVPTSQQSGVSWRYVTEKPAANWFEPNFGEGIWKTGPGVFGTEGKSGAVVRTEWKSSDIWLRRSFEWPSGKVESPRLLVLHDDDVEIYINGVLAGKADGHNTDYDEMDFTPASLATLKPGKNVIAVHCRQTGGGQCIDVGINSVIEKPLPK